MKIALFLLLGLVLLVVVAGLVLYVAGSRMPRGHRSQVTATLKASRPAVWAAITHYSAMPAWWPAVKSVRLETLPDGTELTWNTDRHNRQIPFRTGESRPAEKLVRIIAKDDLPFGGCWTYLLADAPGGGTQITLIEDGVINPPLFRAIATWFFGLDTTQKDYLSHLEKHLSAAKL
jgi:hypothetical protein